MQIQLDKYNEDLRLKVTVLSLLKVPNESKRKFYFDYNTIRGLKSSSHFPKDQPKLITDPVLLKNPLRATQASPSLRKSDQTSSLLPSKETRFGVARTHSAKADSCYPRGCIN
ncbi:hypothetical protein CDAR_236191 [Caerostris darwini]|uniref:Uncharacterized protein n=1 Tax=Caerostris darwini TaxID=1538125 RepID=A0AAV4S065_9ARAC|nr:hypothetical protein CDAR_236191 [Caerostris darwini]